MVRGLSLSRFGSRFEMFWGAPAKYLFLGTVRPFRAVHCTPLGMHGHKSLKGFEFVLI